MSTSSEIPQDFEAAQHLHIQQVFESACRWNNIAVDQMNRGGRTEAMNILERGLCVLLEEETRLRTLDGDSAMSKITHLGGLTLIPCEIELQMTSRARSSSLVDGTPFPLCSNAFLIDPASLVHTIRHVSSVLMHNMALASHMLALETGLSFYLHRAVALYENSFRVVVSRYDPRSQGQTDYYFLFMMAVMCNNSGHIHSMVVSEPGMAYWAGRLRSSLYWLNQHMERSLEEAGTMNKDDDGVAESLHAKTMEFFSSPIIAVVESTQNYESQNNLERGAKRSAVFLTIAPAA